MMAENALPGSGSKPGRGGKREGSGRKTGTPNKAGQAVRELAQSYGLAALERAAQLAGLVLDDNGQPIGKSDSDQIVLAAANVVMDRAYGKAAQALTGSDGEGPVQHMLEISWITDGLAKARRST
jgi:hypothetical protein